MFAIPVVEANPELKEVYDDLVPNPMDFRTIEEERLPRYGSIRELQTDLVTTFRNCQAFNDTDSPYTALAQLMLDSLDEIFQNACAACSVLPRRQRS